MDVILTGIWNIKGRRCARWDTASLERLQTGRRALQKQLANVLNPACAHLAGHGGVKGTVRFVRATAERMPFVARFDVRSYYESIDHGILLEQLAQAKVSQNLTRLVAAYLQAPDRYRTGCGLIAGGALSPLLGALYLTPLDLAMTELTQRTGTRYRRFMDDWVIFAPTRHKLRVAVRRMHRVLAALKLDIHPDKRFIGKTERGFDFLGYRFRPGRKLRPAQQSLDRLTAPCAHRYSGVLLPSRRKVTPGRASGLCST